MRGHPKSHPLSIAQKGIWIKEKFAEPDFSFILAEALEINGPVSPQIFSQALQQLSQEAEATRSCIVAVDDKPRQVILPPSSKSFEFLDFSGNQSPREEAFIWMRGEIRRQHDLAMDGLWFNALIKLGEEHWIWYHRVHHILFDGFSGGLLAGRQAEIYSAMMRGEEAPPCNFGSLEDLLENENNYRSSSHFERDRAYWLEQMTDLPAPATLARTNAMPSGGFLRQGMTIDRGEIALLRAEASKLGASLPQALIAVVAAYYMRATDSQDLTMVTMVTGRISGAMRRIPGMMANAVPLRFRITPEMTWRDLVGQTSSQMMRALRYQRYRYEDLRRDLNLAGPEEQVARLAVNIEPFNYDLRFDGHPATAHNLSNGTMTDFTAFAYDRGDGEDLHLDFDANPALYTPAEMEEHKQRFQNLVKTIIAQPDRPISAISLVTPDERHQLLEGWNDTDQHFAEQSWLDLFKRQVELRPDAAAVIFEERSLSYAALEKASDDWAAVLHERGIGPGQLVAIGLPRCEKMLIAIIAVLKTGAAYIPLDPADPGERIAGILADGRPSLVLCSASTSTLFPESIPHLMFDREPPARTNSQAPLKGPAADDTAYVIFTSGSTGQPKGVEIAHGSLLNFLHAMQSELALTCDDRIVAVTTIAFDIATLELFLPLTVGAATVIATRDTVRDPASLSRLIRNNAVSIMQATPSLWRMLLADHAQDLKGLRPLVGGEALPADLAHMMRALGHPVTNLYGPTETTVWSTCMRLDGADLDSVPIGRPIANTQVYVLDRMLQPVPPGMIGELYIAGAGVAKGYLNKPEMTAERFFANPFLAEGEGRIYRTGDLARWRADGVLEYLGRNDHQIKIRGFRVEPGEIEAALMSVEAVRQAVVVLRDDGRKSQQLVAYLVTSTAEPIDTSWLSKKLADTVPAHMIPASYVFLDALPLNTNGKIDRKALPAPQQRVATDHIAPSTPTELVIAEIWCQILDIESVGINDNFFQLGGDSLAAASMMSALSRQMGGQMTWSQLSEAPTIANLARHLEKPEQQSASIEPVLSIRPNGSQPPLFCIHPITGLGWAFASLAQHVHETIPIHALQADWATDIDLKPQSIQEQAARYLQHIRQIQPEGPYHMLGWSFGGLIAHEISRMIEQDGGEIAFLALLDSYPFLPPSGTDFNDEVVLAKAALGFLGFDERALGDRPAFSALSEFLTREYQSNGNALFEMMIRHDADFIDRLRTVILHHLDIAQHFVPGRLRSELHFFRAQPAPSKTIHEILNFQVEAWRPHTAGTIHRHEMDCTHEEMLLSKNAARVAGIFMEKALQAFISGKPQEALLQKSF